jgi:DNA-binding MarR family transcriptional regulator/GNAT superfamily N-acetyltransferase
MRDRQPAAVRSVRRFTRFFTGRIGVLNERLLRSPFSLTEARVLYELAHRREPTATELGRDLGLDAGYLSRILRAFRRRGLVECKRSSTDGRRSLLKLTRRGHDAFAPLDARSNDEIAALLRHLSPADERRLEDAMKTIEGLLAQRATKPADANPAYILRPHQPGDIGWIVHRHGVLYAREHGYDEQFEALVASIVARFVQRFDPKKERCWIAEKDGEIVGSVFLVKQTRTLAKLRLLLVEPSARGLGIGGRLVDECIRFARLAGYRKITLWTQSHLGNARRIYERAGFRIAGSTRHHSFGKDLVAETWDLTL